MSFKNALSTLAAGILLTACAKAPDTADSHAGDADPAVRQPAVRQSEAPGDTAQVPADANQTGAQGNSSPQEPQSMK